MKLNIFKIKVLSFFKSNNFNFDNLEEFKFIKYKFLGKIGIINILIRLNNSRRNCLVILNKLKKKLNCKIKYKSKKLKIDVFENLYLSKNNVNPLYYFIEKIEDFFIKLGFKYILGDEIKNVYNNFSFLRITEDHPSRSFRDTFYLSKKYVIRTHMTSLYKEHFEKKFKYFKNNKPFKTIFSGKVYRRDKGSFHLSKFHQIDGVIFKKKFINFKYFVKIFKELIDNVFEKKCFLRYRNSHFPFTLPSYEIDIKLNRYENWIEVCGAGNMHEDILNKLNSNLKGFAFGIGVERLIMSLFKIKNILKII
ncbi:tRNA ligase subunit PheS family protein [Candidatus Vidania fulgoroideorum]